MKALSASAVAILAILSIAGCAQDGTLTTGALTTPGTGPQTADAADPKADPVCMTLTSQIEALKKNGVAEKVSKAAAKKYKMNAADLAKADELNKANAEFRARCSNYPPSADVATAAPEPAKTAATKKPPVPAHKPVASAAATTAAPIATTYPAATTAPAANEAVAQSPPQP